MPRDPVITPNSNIGGSQADEKVAAVLENGAAEPEENTALASLDAELDRCKSSVPEGFKLLADGVYPLKRDGESRTLGDKISGPIVAVARARTFLYEDWSTLLVFVDHDGRTREFPIPDADLGDDRFEYQKSLRGLGLKIHDKHGLHEYLNAFEPKGRVRCVNRMGWHNDVYVLSDVTFGDTGDERIVPSARIFSADMGTRGSLQDWRENVGKLCEGNSRLLLFTSTAFAAPLAEPMGVEGGGFNAYGGSGIGKTKTLKVAASVWGEPKSYMRSWRATANGLEGTCAAHNNGLLCIDEMGMVNSRELSQSAYMIANGQGKQRAKKDGTDREIARWHVLFLSTGEITLEDKMRESGQEARAGQEVRIVDFPADAGAGLGMFEELHGRPNGHEFAIALENGTSSYFGTPIRSFLDQVATDRDECLSFARKEIDRFEAEFIPKNADGQVLRVAQRFSIIAAGGELATKLGVTGWQEGQAYWGVGECTTAWLEKRGGTGPLEIIKALKQVRDFLEKHGSARFERMAKKNSDGAYHSLSAYVRDRAGFCEKSTEGRAYYVLPSGWAEMCMGHDRALVAKELKKRGLLHTSADGRNQVSKRLPGIGLKRVYHLKPEVLSYDYEADPLG